MEVPTIYKAYFLGLCKGISLENMPLYGTVPPFQDLGIPIDCRVSKIGNERNCEKKRRTSTDNVFSSHY